MGLIVKDDGWRMPDKMWEQMKPLIPPGKKHRMIALEDCDVFEVSTPHLEDVVRLEDGYGRIPSK